MPTHSGPNIMEKGVVLSLDASDKNSYPGSGNTWYDLSGSGQNGNITGATYNNNEKRFSFNAGDKLTAQEIKNNYLATKYRFKN